MHWLTKYKVSVFIFSDRKGEIIGASVHVLQMDQNARQGPAFGNANAHVNAITDGPSIARDDRLAQFLRPILLNFFPARVRFQV